MTIVDNHPQTRGHSLRARAWFSTWQLQYVLYILSDWPN